MPPPPMSRDETARFRPTLWPGSVIPVPPVPRASFVGVTPEGFLVYRGRLPDAAVPDELFLRQLLDLDTSDTGEDGAVTEFLARYGVISLPYSDELLTPCVKPPANLPDFVGVTNHVLDARLYLETAQLLSLHWVADASGDDVTAVWTTNRDRRLVRGDVSTAPLEAHRAVFGEEFPYTSSVDLAWFNFVRCINWGLRAMHVRVEYPGPAVTDAHGKPLLGLYSALCLQIVNAMAEGATVRLCHNEPCGRPFTRQQGRAEHGQFRTEGVIYCSKACARAKAERERRRRKSTKEKP